jgi:RNA polymerase sigma factor (sigma-70 family)
MADENTIYVIGAGQCPRELTDHDLLKRYATDRDNAAFAGLLYRHGPMVLGVCRRVLRNVVDVDDAFQATFLVLVRKAGSIRKAESVGSWLHGVAFRVASKAKKRADMQPLPEGLDMTGREPDPSAEAIRRELRFILDQELDRLPAKYRAPLVLHYLEGKTKEQTARELGWPEGTVSDRLSHGLKSLRKAVRIKSLSDGMMAAIMAEQTATSPVPAVLTNATINAVKVFGTGAVATRAATEACHSLAEAVVKGMIKSKLKRTIPMAIVLLAATLGVVVASQRLLPPAHPPVPVAADEPKYRAMPIARFRMNHKGLGFVAFSPNGKTLASGSNYYATIKLWDVATGKEQAPFDEAYAGGPMAFSPDGKTLAATSSIIVTFPIMLIDLATGKKKAMVNNLHPQCYCVVFSPDSKTLASGTTYGLKLWALDTGEEQVISEHCHAPSVAFSPDGRTLASWAGGRGVTLWKVRTGNALATFKQKIDGAKIGPLSFSPDGKTLASWSEAGTIKLWDVETGKEQASFGENVRGGLASLTFSPDGKTLASGQEGTIKLWDVETRKEWATLKEGYTGQWSWGAGCLSFSPDGKTLASVSGDTIIVWDMQPEQ